MPGQRNESQKAEEPRERRARYLRIPRGTEARQLRNAREDEP
jgi:hypothetical protein